MRRWHHIQKCPRGKVIAPPEAGQPTEVAAVNNSTAPDPHPSTEETPHACYEGVVYICHLVEQAGEEVEAFEAIPCRRCAGETS